MKTVYNSSQAMEFFLESREDEVRCEALDRSAVVGSYAEAKVFFEGDGEVANELIKEQCEAAGGDGLCDGLQPVRDLLGVQGQHGNWNYDAYMLGLYNGMECALAALEDREAVYREKPEGGFLADRVPEPTEVGTPTASSGPPKGGTPTLAEAVGGQ